MRADKHNRAAAAAAAAAQDRRRRATTSSAAATHLAARLAGLRHVHQRQLQVVAQRDLAQHAGDDAAVVQAARPVHGASDDHARRQRWGGGGGGGRRAERGQQRPVALAGGRADLRQAQQQLCARTEGGPKGRSVSASSRAEEPGPERGRQSRDSSSGGGRARSKSTPSAPERTHRPWLGNSPAG